MYFWRSVISGCIVVCGVLACSVLVYFWSKDECPVGTLSCSAGGGVCVPHRSVCDGHNDCLNGQDEDPALCYDWTGSVQMINNAHNRSKLENADFHRTENVCELFWYPSYCRCSRRSRLTCKQLGLTETPRDISGNVTHLNLANNTIRTLNVDSFSEYKTLKVIHLEGNKLLEIHPGTFKGPKRLRILLLMRNSLTSLKNGAFSELNELLWLILYRNRLESIEMDCLNDLKSVEWIDLSDNKLTLENESFPGLLNLLELDLGYNSIHTVTRNTFSQLINLELLNLRRNRLTCLDRDAFGNLGNLRELNLFGNDLHELDRNLFAPLGLLRRLYLGHNPLHHIPSELFAELEKLASLNLEAIEIDNIDVTTFSKLKNLVSVYFKTYRYCSYAPNVPHCRPLSDGISSAYQLLEKPILRYAVWIICFVTCTGNILVIWGRLQFRDENKVLGLLIRNLAASDLLMGLYLLIIGYHDTRFRNIYNTKAHEWMSSWLCTAAGALAMVSSEVSVLLLVFMSVERVLLIAIPFGRFSYVTVGTAAIFLVCIWAVGIGLAVIPAIEFHSSTRFYGLSGLCFPLHIEDPYLLGWKYSAFVILGINGVGLLIITTVYCIMFISIWKTRHATSLPVKDFEFAIRFFFIVFTDASCWFPIILVKLFVLLGAEISDDLYAWLVVFVLPVNSAVNPLLYTLTTPKYRSKVGRMNVSWFPDNQNVVQIENIKHQSHQSIADTGSTPTASRSVHSANLNKNKF